MTAIDPVGILREMLERLEHLLEEYDRQIAKIKRERIALMAAIGALEAVEKPHE